MDWLKSLGGLTGLMELVKNPAKVPELLAAQTPGATHTLGRMRLLQELSARSAMLTSQCHNLLAVCLLEKRDVSQEEIDGLNTIEHQFLRVAERLYKYPKVAADVSLQTLKETYGIQQKTETTQQGITEAKS